jgi:N-acetylglucosamine-6-phosphate deacetylase
MTTRLTSATIVLPDRILHDASLAIEDDRIVEVGRRTVAGGRDLHGHVIVPGFIDVHVHGVEGMDALEGAEVISRLAARFPRFGVTAFCPTSIACVPSQLRDMLKGIRHARATPAPGAARVLPAHLESNFISPDYKGAQPLRCLCTPNGRAEGDFTGHEILAEIEAARPDVAIVTVAPEVEGVLALIPELVRHGHRVSLGHSGATYDQSQAGIDAGARHATHLFNRMTGLHHRDPGLVGAVLESDALAAELICDGVHVHPAAVRSVLAAKGPGKIMAITDGTAAAGLPRGATTNLGGRPITVGDVARLEDGTIAGSVLTMDAAFRLLVQEMGVTLIDAAQMCSSTPARELGLYGHGVLTTGSVADFVVLDRDLRVVETYISGRPVLQD